MCLFPSHVQNAKTQVFEVLANHVTTATETREILVNARQQLLDLNYSLVNFARNEFEADASKSGNPDQILAKFSEMLKNLGTNLEKLLQMTDQKEIINTLPFLAQLFERSLKIVGRTFIFLIMTKHPNLSVKMWNGILSSTSLSETIGLLISLMSNFIDDMDADLRFDIEKNKAYQKVIKK